MENAINKLNQIVEQLLAIELVSIAIKLSDDKSDADIQKQMDIALGYIVEARKKIKRTLIYQN